MSFFVLLCFAFGVVVVVMMIVLVPGPFCVLPAVAGAHCQLVLSQRALCGDYICSSPTAYAVCVDGCWHVVLIQNVFLFIYVDRSWVLWNVKVGCGNAGKDEDHQEMKRAEKHKTTTNAKRPHRPLQSNQGLIHNLGKLFQGEERRFILSLTSDEDDGN
jgi:hypothetical protein